jgi:hypothetical protein
MLFICNDIEKQFKGYFSNKYLTKKKQSHCEAKIGLLRSYLENSNFEK